MLSFFGLLSARVSVRARQNPYVVLGYVSAPTCFGYVSAVREQSRSRRARNTLQINLGLLALKNCINALHNNLAHTPYQDSKLTMLLQGPLPRLLDDRPSWYLRSCATHSARATAPSVVPILRANHCARNSPICPRHACQANAGSAPPWRRRRIGWQL